jgi:hypothetical protein
MYSDSLPTNWLIESISRLTVKNAGMPSPFFVAPLAARSPFGSGLDHGFSNWKDNAPMLDYGFINRAKQHAAICWRISRVAQGYDGFGTKHPL